MNELNDRDLEPVSAGAEKFASKSVTTNPPTQQRRAG